MNYSEFPLLCYWGGEVLQERGDIIYRGGTTKFVFVGKHMSISEVLNKLYDAMKCNPMNGELKVQMKYPVLGSYTTIALDDDNSLRALWHAVTCMKAHTMQLFIEQAPKRVIVEHSLTSSLVVDSRPTFSPTMPSTNLSLSGKKSLPGIPSDGHMPEFTSSTSLPHVGTLSSSSSVCKGEIHGSQNVRVTNDCADESSSLSRAFRMAAKSPPRFLDPLKTWLRRNSAAHDGEFAVGQVFDSLEELKYIVNFYSILVKQSYVVKEVKSTKYVVECIGKGECDCPWRLYATKIRKSTSFRIVSYDGPHASNCNGKINSVDHPLLIVTFVSNHMHDLILVDPSLKLCDIRQLIKDQFHYSITYERAWLSKQRAIAMVFGDWDISYEELPKFMQALKETNQGTVVLWCTIPTSNPSIHMFKRVFWAFKPSIDGFKHCRPLITVNGTHLYGKYKGAILVAMGTDANFQLFPLAFAIVEEENGESWSWFMSCIRRSVTQREDLCVISGSHHGIKNAMTEIGSGWEEPYAYHRLCIRDLCSRFHSQFKNDHLKDLFWQAGGEQQRNKFDACLVKMGELNIEAREYLKNIPLYLWSIHYDGGFRYGIRTSNSSEVFLGLMKGTRYLPITALVKTSFYRANSYFVTRREWGKRRLEEGHDYSEKATTVIEKNMQKSVQHDVISLDHERGLFEVKTGRGTRPLGKGEKVYTVNLDEKSCTCEKLKIYKLPCSHILAVCQHQNLSHAQFVDPFYTTYEYRQTYLNCFVPIPDVAYYCSPYVGPRIVANAGLKRSVRSPCST